MPVSVRPGNDKGETAELIFFPHIISQQKTVEKLFLANAAEPSDFNQRKSECTTLTAEGLSCLC